MTNSDGLKLNLMLFQEFYKFYSTWIGLELDYVPRQNKEVGKIYYIEK